MDKHTLASAKLMKEVRQSRQAAATSDEIPIKVKAEIARVRTSVDLARKELEALTTRQIAAEADSLLSGEPFELSSGHAAAVAKAESTIRAATVAISRLESNLRAAQAEAQACGDAFRAVVLSWSAVYQDERREKLAELLSAVAGPAVELIAVQSLRDRLVGESFQVSIDNPAKIWNSEIIVKRLLAAIPARLTSTSLMDSEISSQAIVVSNRILEEIQS